jgi:hypothetical protein
MTLSLVDAADGKGVPHATCNFYNPETKASMSLKTDKAGVIKKTLRRCDFFLVECKAEGYIKEHPAKCTEPHLLSDGEEKVTEAISKILPDGQMRAVLTWREDDKYLKDLDLHMLIPGRRDVYLKDYKKRTKGAYSSGAPSYASDATSHGKDYIEEKKRYSSGLIKKTYKATDLSEKNDPYDEPEHIFWDKKGLYALYPYVTYELDHGSILGSPTTGGPEVIRVHKELQKQYLLWVDCWSCDEYEDKHGLDQKRKLTKASLEQFQTWSQATVKVFSGKEQITCNTIGTAKNHPTTRWDAVLLHPNGKKVEVSQVNEFKKGYPTVKW